MAFCEKDIGRSPTFVVGTADQRGILEQLQVREQQITEQLGRGVRLCFNARAYQRTHPSKAMRGHSDADVTLVSPMLLGVADGVSQIEDYGIDASLLPKELLKACERLAMSALMPDDSEGAEDAYAGPISLVSEAYESTESLGSTTLLLTIMDNRTQIHCKVHPMIAVISIGDCEVVVLRRQRGKSSPLEVVFHTEMQRVGGHCQSPLQIARVDDTVDPAFDESIALEVISKGSAVHCISAFLGDILVLGSDGVFDNLFLDEVVEICNRMLPAPEADPNGKSPGNIDPNLLQAIARRIVEESHMKSAPDKTGEFAASPIGKGGKVDDTSCIVGEVIKWTQAHNDAWDAVVRNRQWNYFASCGGQCKRPCASNQERSKEKDNTFAGCNIA